MLWALTSGFNISLPVAGVIATEFAICSNFLFNEIWTFYNKANTLQTIHSRFIKFNIISVGGLIISVSILMFLTYLGVYYLLANLIGIFVAFLWNYKINRRFTWTDRMIDDAEIEKQRQETEWKLATLLLLPLFPLAVILSGSIHTFKKIKLSLKIYKPLAFLCCLSVFIEVLIFIVTLRVFHSFVDLWSLKVYFETIVVPFIQGGQLPYINYFWEYPILMTVPVFIATIPVFLLKDSMVFFTAFPILMVGCNLITTILVYLITLKIYKNKKRAVIAGFLYATAIFSAYVSLIVFDPMPAMLVLLGLTLTVYGEKEYGYLAYILGFFTKIFPVAVLPFAVLYNAKKSGLKQEIISILKVGIIPFLILFGAVWLINPAMIDTYLIKNAASKEIFVSSFVYVVYSWLHLVISGITVGMVATGMTVSLIGIMGYLVYRAWIAQKQDPVLLLQLTLIALVAVIACSKYHSPQYMIWFTPILCVLATGNLLKMGLFYLLQVIWYIKFPLSYWSVWVNEKYVQPIALLFFTIEYAVLFYLVWKVSSPLGGKTDGR
jgi:putative flippase GtrA